MVSDGRTTPLIDEFKGLDPVDAAAAIGALQVLPHNASALGRLEVVAAAVVGLSPDRGRQHASPGRLRHILDHPEVRARAAHEDPFDDLFTEAVRFQGGLHIASGGLAQDGIFVLGLLAGALDDRNPPDLDPQFVREAVSLGTGALRISDVLLRDAGLDRNQMPGDKEPLVLIPGAKPLAQLKDAMTFTRAEIDDLLAPASLTARAIEDLVQDFGQPVRAAQGEVSVMTRPIVRDGDRLIVIAPTAITNAVRHAILSRAVETGDAAALTVRFRRQAESRASEAAQAMGMSPFEFRPSTPAADELGETFIRFDDDKVIHLLVLTEDLTSYEPEVVHRVWEAGELASQAFQRQQEIRAELHAQDSTLEAFEVTAFQPAGSGWFGAERAESDGQPVSVSLTVAELDSIAAVESGEPLALYKWAKQRMTSAHDVLAMFDRVDAYQSYRERDYSYPAPIEQVSSLLGAVGGGLALRAEAKTRRDEHLALRNPPYGAEVVRLSTEEPSEPVYRLKNLDKTHPLLLEVFDIPVWVSGPEARSAEDFDANGNVCRTVCFWLWQMAPSLEPLISGVRNHLRLISIQLNLGGQAAFLETDSSRAGDLGNAALTNESVGGIGVQVNVGPGTYMAMRKAGNEGERCLMRLVLAGVASLAEAHGVEGSSETEIDRLIARTMGNPRKKHLLVFDAAHQPALNGRALPRARFVQRADSQIVKDELGSYLVEELGLAPGPIPLERRKRVLLAARERCLQMLLKELAELEPNGLLERLVLANETQVFARAQRRLRLPTRLACYESEPEATARLKKEVPQSNLAMLAGRFLIECVTAQPPSGSRRHSQATVDRLMALAAELLDHAGALSAVGRGLSDQPYAISEAGRLIPTEGDTFWTGQATFLDTYVESEIDQSASEFELHWGRPQEAPDLPFASRDALEEPMRAECGLPFSKLEEVLVRLVESAGRRAEPAVAQRAELVPEMSREAGLSTTDVEGALDFLALRSRSAFLPEGADKTDIQPWHFNRDLSYNRRPLLIRERPDGEQVIWGMRHTAAAFELMASYLFDGKFKARSAELKTVLGAISNDRGRAFEDQLADLYGSHDRFKVLRRRDKLNGVPVVRADGQDIDVLVAEPSRRHLAAIDAKDLAPSLTPSDVARELGRSFETRGNRAAAMDRHLERVEWLKGHRKHALIEFGLPTEDADRWSVEGMMVTSYDLISTHMITPALPVKSFRQIKAELERPPPPLRRRRARRS